MAKIWVVFMVGMMVSFVCSGLVKATQNSAFSHDCYNKRAESSMRSTKRNKNRVPKVYPKRKERKKRHGIRHEVVLLSNKIEALQKTMDALVLSLSKA